MTVRRSKSSMHLPRTCRPPSVVAAAGVCSALLLTALSPIGCTSTEPAADLTLTGGVVATLDGDHRRMISISGDRIAPDGPAARTVDLGGAFVLPGLVDHHVHLLNVGMSILNRERGGSLHIDLSGMDLDATRAALAERAGAAPSAWILGKGWSQANWGASLLPDRNDIDAVVPETPVFLTRVDGHAAWTNSAGLSAAGIDRDTADPQGGRIARDRAGRATGLLLERAAELATARLPRTDDQTLRAAFRAGAEALAAQGVVEVFDAGFLTPPGIVDLGRDLSRDLDLLVAEDTARPLPLTIHLMIPAASALADRLVDAGGMEHRRSARIDITHIKLFADGAMGSRGASLSHPYADDPQTDGIVRLTSEEIGKWSRLALNAGLGVATHAIGDAAVGRTLDAYEALLAERPTLNPRRLRIEHFSYASEEDIERAARLGIVLSVQPNFVYPDDEGVTMEGLRVGDGADRVYALGTLVQRGAALAFGSDYFTAPAQPLLTLYSAVTRQNPDGLPPDGWHPDERLDRATALEMNVTAHRPGGATQSRRLSPGASADLVILDRDPRSADNAELLKTRVLATIHQGRVVFSDGSIEGLASLEPDGAR